MLYIHIPFCEKKCNYCDFLSFHADYPLIDNYIKTLLKEIENKAYLANDYIIKSIYIGGGTPSFIDAKFIGYILESIQNHYKLSTDCEISMEANPNSATRDKLKAIYDFGINRLSFGLQSCNDDELKILGRIHTYSDFLNAYDNAIHVGFKNINVDIINGIPNQTPESYKKSLKQVLSLNTKHISIYNLIIEPNTKFFDMHNNGELNLPDENQIIEIDEITKELTQYYRLQRYEISNYAKESFECKHNIGYWSLTPYLGFGLNASSYINSTRYKNISAIKEYINLSYDKYITTNDKDIGIYYDEIKMQTKIDQMNDFVMLGFRKISGINAEIFYKRFNEIFKETFRDAIIKYETKGYLINDNGNYYLTDEGLNISNTILSDFLL